MFACGKRMVAFKSGQADVGMKRRKRERERETETQR